MCIHGKTCPETAKNLKTKTGILIGLVSFQKQNTKASLKGTTRIDKLKIS